MSTEREDVYDSMFDDSINSHVLAKTEALKLYLKLRTDGSKTVSRYIVMFHEEMVLYITCYYCISEIV